MTIEEHEQILANIMQNAGDQGALSEYLQSLREDYSETTNTVTSLNTEKDTLLSKNEKLREVNSNLFLKVGNVKDLFEPPKPKDPPNPEEPELKYEDLVSQEGELI
jgi:hypothetical protein